MNSSPTLTQEPRALPGPLLATLAALLLHASLAWWIPVLKFGKYPAAAEFWRAGQLSAERLLDFSPLYLSLHRLANSWFGSAASTVIEGLQILLVALVCGALYWLIRRHASHRVAALLVGLFAIDRHLVIYARVLEPEICQLALLLGFLVALELARDHAASWPALGAGVLAALSLANRPTLLPVFVLTLLFLWLGRRPLGQGQLGLDRRRLRPPLLFLLPILLGIGLMAARSAYLVGDFRTPVMNPGTVFFEGNNPLSRGTSAVYPPLVSAALDSSREQPDAPHQLYRDFARVSTNQQLSVRQVNAYWSQLARRFLLDQPGHALGLWSHKLWLALHSFRFHDLPTAWRMDLAIHTPAIPFPLFVSLAILGVVVSRRRWRHWWPLLGVAMVQLAVMVVFYVSARQRLPLLAVATVLAAPAISWLAAARRRQALAVGLGIAAAVAALSLPSPLIRDVLYQERGIARATELLRQLGELNTTAPVSQHGELAIEALARAPWHHERMRPAFLLQEEASIDQKVLTWLSECPEQSLSLRFDQAVLALRTAQPALAWDLLTAASSPTRAVYRRGHQSSTTGLYLARASLQNGDLQGALGILRHSLEENPGESFLLAELIALGEGRYATELQRYWSVVDGQYLLGLAMLENNRASEAVAALRFVTRRLPKVRRAKIYLAAALGAAGRLEDGGRLYLETVSRRGAVEPVLADRWIPDLFRRWHQAAPQRPDIRLYAAQVLRQYGFPHEALGLLQDQPMPEQLRGAAAQELVNIRRLL